MAKYEIMLILDPSSDEKVVSEIAKSTFKSKDVKVEKMERTELAYEINKSKTATYVLVNAEASGNEINEFTRKANISKSIWRLLSINLDSEKGLNRKAKPKRVKRSTFPMRKNAGERNEKTLDATTSNSESINTQEEKTEKTTKSTTTKVKKEKSSSSTTKKATTKKVKEDKKEE